MAGETRFITWSGGPAGDYITDGTHDEAEINTAMSWLNSNPGNILIMRGTGNVNSPHYYNIEAQVKIANNMKWTAEAGVMLWVPDGACGTNTTNCVFPNGTPVIGQLNTYVAHVEISGFSISGNCNNQSTVLGYAHGVLQSTGSGVERLFGFKGVSGTGSKCTDIYIHDIHAMDSWGEFLHLMYGRGEIKISNCLAENHQHDCVMLIEVDGDGNEITDSTFYGITDGCVRLDNCKKIPVHDCYMLAYSGTHNNGATKYGHNGMQIANESNKTLLTNEISVYNCYFEGPNLDGIWLNDQLKTAGSADQSVYIHHCKFSNQIAWADWAYWSSGITLGAWGNGVKIESCTFDGCYANGIQVYSVISSAQTHKLEIENCNIINTVGLRAGSSNGPSVQGWGLYNAVPTKMSIVAKNNYLAGNINGDYKNVTPVTSSTSLISGAEPGGGSTIDDDDSDYVPPESSGVYIPASASIIDTDFKYVPRADDDFRSYINGVPFEMVRFLPVGQRGISESESPSFEGTNLGDLGLKGCEIELTGLAADIDELYKIKAAFAQEGRSFLELGGSRKGYFVSGLMSTHGSTEDMSQGDIAGENIIFNATVKTEFPYQEKMIKAVRDHYVNSSCIISSDDIHSGNVVKNNNFLNWSVPQNLVWETIPGPSSADLQNVKYSPELQMWMAVGNSVSGADPQCIISGRSVIPDHSGYKNHGLASGAWESVTGGGVSFNGIDSYVAIPDPEITNTSNYSLYSRFKVGASGVIQSLVGIAKSDSNVQMCNITLNTSNQLLLQHRDDAGHIANVSSSINVNDGLVHEAVGTRDGDTFTIYLDGVQVGQVINSTIGTTTTDRAAIGCLPRLSSRYLFTGEIYETRIFSDTIPSGSISTAGTRTTNRVSSFNSPTTEEPGNSWITPPWWSALSSNRNNWKGLEWCPDWGMWVISSVTSYLGVDDKIAYTADGAEWFIVTTPSDSNSWANLLFIPPNSTVPNGRLMAFAQSGTGNRILYSDNQLSSYTTIAGPADVLSNNWLSSAYSQELNRVVVVAFGGSASKRVMYSDDCGSNFISVVSPAQQWTGVIWAKMPSMFMACSQDGTQQIMTCADGISPWTLQTTPYADAVTPSGSSTVVRTLAAQSNVGWNYTTLATDYSASVNPMIEFVLPASGLTAGNHYRIDNVHARLRIVSAGPTAYLKVTAQTATISETTIKEWTETSTVYQDKSYDCVFEGAADEAVTIRFYLKTSNASIRAGADNMGYDASEMTSGSSTITYSRNLWRDICYSDELNLAVVVCYDTSLTNNVMYSQTGTNWYMVPSIAAAQWWSVEYSPETRTFIAVGQTGSERVMLARGYGELVDIAPDNWTKVTDGQEASDEHTNGSVYTYMIKGNGVDENPGYIYQKLPFDSMYDAGELYILKSSAYVEGLTSGAFAVDIFAGGTIVKELIWDANTSEIDTKEIRFIFDTIPLNVYARIRGINTPNDGAYFYNSNIIVSKVQEYENDQVGAPIATFGYRDATPNIKLKGVGTNTMSADTNRIISDKDYDTYTTTSTSYGDPIKTITLPALTGGSKYQLDALSFDFKTNSTGAYIYCKTTIQAPSLFGGAERDISMYTTNGTSYEYRRYKLPYPLISETNEQVIFRWYIRISKTGYTGYVKNAWYQFTELLDVNTTKNVPIYLYNTNDSRIVLTCCDSLPPGYQVEINKNGTGSYRYIESFADDNFISNAYEVVGGVSRDETEQTLYIPDGGSITFPMSTYYPVSGVPFIKMLVVSGIPQISIAVDTGSGPGTFYEVDSNTSVSVENAEVIRLLDNAADLTLRGERKFYVKISNLSGASCTFGQMLIYSTLDTIDARRLKIYSAINPNAIAVEVGGDGKCSAVLSIDYRDTQIIT